MTSEQAKTKWCPMVREANGGGANTFDDDRNPDYARCIGPECALWREEGKQQETGRSTGECGLIAPRPLA